MPGKAFFDTNVVVYAFSSNELKKRIALELLSGGGTISIQTLNEFVNVANRKMKRPWRDIEHWLDGLRAVCATVPVTMAVHEMGMKIAQESRYHIYDSLMLAAAIEAGCTVFYSEDMQDGQTIGDLTICNPFA